jgi:O-antigen/teichoic acid export membrane protein
MLRNVGSNWMLIVVTIAATYVTTPFIIRTLGDERYGTWLLISSMTSYISLLALGVPMACVRYLAQYVAERDVRRINQTIGTCAGLYLMVGATAVIFGGFLAYFFRLYHIPTTFRPNAYVAFSLMVIFVSMGFIGLLPEGIMFAHHDFLRRNVVRIGGVLLRLALTLALLKLSASLVLLAIVQLLGLTFDFTVSCWLIRRHYPGLRISLADFDWKTLRQILSFSLYVLLLAAGARLSFETDSIVIGGMLGVGLIPFYAVANSLVVYLMDFFSSIAAVVSPTATALGAQGRLDELRDVFLKWSKGAVSLTIALSLFLIVLGPRFIAWWIDPSFERPAGDVLQILLFSCFVFLPVRAVAQPLLIGLGKPGLPTVGFLVAGFLNLGLSIALARPYGLAGVALGTAIPNVLFGLVVTIAACRELRITLADYLRYVVPRAALGAVPVLVLLLWFRLGLQVQSFRGLAAAGFAMVVLYGLVWITFVYRDDPYVDMRAPFLRLRAWSRA